MDLTRAAWRKSSYSSGGSNCVEVANTSDSIAVRDSKDPAGGTHTVHPSAWRSMISALQSGRI